MIEIPVSYFRLCNKYLFLIHSFNIVLTALLFFFSINLLVVYRESVNLIGYITRRLSADSLQL